MGDDDGGPSRRRFLGYTTCAIGGGIGLSLLYPVVRLVADPMCRQTVTTPTEPIDIGAADRLRVAATWQQVPVIAPVIADAWSTSHDVVLGGAFIRQPAAGKLEALSAVCPHLGCAVGYDPGANTFLCPCHNSRWDRDGNLLPDGKAQRGLDPLPIEVKDGRLRLTWVAYKLDTAAREPA